jgi:hypothetical protein
LFTSNCPVGFTTVLEKAQKKTVQKDPQQSRRNYPVGYTTHRPDETVRSRIHIVQEK